MKKILLTIIIILTVILNIYAEDYDWGYLSENYIKASSSEVLDNNEATYAIIMDNFIDITFNNLDKIELLQEVSFYLQGEINISLYKSSDKLFEANYSLSDPDYVSISLKEINKLDYPDLIIRVTSNDYTTRNNIYEAFVSAKFKKDVDEIIQIDANKNSLVINTGDKEKGFKYSLDLIFESANEDIEGKLMYSCGGNYNTTFYVLINKYDKKELFFPYLPFDNYGKISLKFIPKTGNLIKGILRKRIIENKEIEIYKAEDITENAEIYNSYNALDNDIGSEFCGEYTSGEERVIKVELSKTIYNGFIKYYFIPGYTDKIEFEGIFADGTKEYLGEMNNVDFYRNELNEKIFNPDYDNLKCAGYKIFKIENKNKKYNGVQIKITPIEGYNPGGISDIGIYGISADYSNNKLFSPKGGAYYHIDSAIILYDESNHQIRYKSFDLLSKSRWNEAIGKIGFNSKLYSVVDTYEFREGNNKFILPTTLQNTNNINFNFPPYNVFSLDAIDLSGDLQSKSDKIYINNSEVEYNFKKGNKSFWKRLAFEEEGMFYITTSLNDDINKRKKIDRIYVDKTPPEINVIYPETRYINTNTFTIKGYIRDLTPLKVEINGVEAKLTGRWFELTDVEATDDQLNIYEIKAYDKAGYVTTIEFPITVDKTPPALNITNFGALNYTNDNTVDIICDVRDTSKITLTMGLEEVVLEESGIFAFEGIMLAPDDNIFRVRALDEAGNESSIEINIIQDRITPEIFDVKELYYTNKENFTFKARLVDNYDSFLLYGSGINVDDGIVKEVNYLDNGDIEYIYTINVDMRNVLNTKDIDITLIAYDYAGNEEKKVVKIVKDIDPPVLNVTNLQALNYINEDYVDINCEIEDISKVKLTLNDAKETEINKIGSYIYKAERLNPDDNIFTIKALDEAGNETVVEINVIQDKIIPQILGVEEIYYINYDEFNIDVRVVDNYSAELTYSIDSILSKGIIKETNHLENGLTEIVYSVTVDMRTKDDEDITLLAKDSAGNEVSNQIKIVKDKIAPEITITSHVNNEWTKNREINISGKYIDENIDYIKINGILSNISEDNFSLNNFELLLDGANNITVEAKDKAGNISVIMYKIYLDTIPPGSPKVRAISENDKINVYWSITETKDLDYYLIKRIPDFSNTSEQNGIKKLYENIYEDTDIDYEKEIYYIYYVKSVDRSGNESGWQIGSNGRQTKFNTGEESKLEYDSMTLNWKGTEFEYGTDISVHAIEEPAIKDSGLFFSPIYDFGPEILEFDYPLEINYPVNSELMENEKLAWFYYNPDKEDWERIPCFYDESNDKLIGAISHFSAYTIKEDNTQPVIIPQFTKEDDNLLVSESSGSITIMSNELTLKGPGDYDFTLNRSINSNKIAQDSKRTVPRFKKVVPLYNTSTHTSGGTGNVALIGGTNKTINYGIIDDTIELLRANYYVGGWNYNLPVVDGSSIILEDGTTINIDYLYADQDKIIMHKEWFKIRYDSSGLLILQTISGKKYFFNNFYTNLITSRNSSSKDKIFVKNETFKIVDKIIYSDGTILSFSGNKIYWGEDQTNAIEYNNDYCENIVTKEKVIYEHTNEHIITALDKNEYIDNYLSSAKYTKNGIGDYTIKYNYNNMFDDTNLAPNLKIVYPAKKLVRINFSRDLKYSDDDTIFSYEKNNLLLTDIKTFRIKDNAPDNIIEIVDDSIYLIQESNKIYTFDREKNRPSPNFLRCIINYYNKDNLIEKNIIREYNHLGDIISEEDENSLTNYEYYGYSSGYLERTLDSEFSIPENFGNISQYLSVSGDYHDQTISYNKGLDNFSIRFLLSFSIAGLSGIYFISPTYGELIYEAKYDVVQINWNSWGYTSALLVQSIDYELCLSPNYFKLKSGNSLSVYCSIYRNYQNLYFNLDSKIYLFFHENSKFEGKTSKIISCKKDQMGNKTDTNWVSFQYDDFLRTSKVEDNKGNVTAYNYIIDDDNVENDLNKIEKIEIGHNEDGEIIQDSEIKYEYESYICELFEFQGETEFNNKQKEIWYWNNVEMPAYMNYLQDSQRYLRTKNITVTSKKNGSNDLKYVTYDYYTNKNKSNYKVQNIYTYKENKSDLISKKYFEYNTDNLDNTLKKVTIYGSDGGIDYLHQYNYENGSGLLTSDTDGNGNTTTYQYDFLGRNTRKTFADETYEENIFDDYNASYKLKINHSENPTHNLYEETINYFDNRVEKVNYITKYGERIITDGSVSSNHHSEDGNIDYNDTRWRYTANKSNTKTYNYNSLGQIIDAFDFKNLEYNNYYENGFLIKSKTPDNNFKEYLYDIVTINYQFKSFKVLQTTIIDEEGKQKRIFIDVNGNNIGVIEKINNKWIGNLIIYNNKNLPEIILESCEYTVNHSSYSVNKIETQTIETALEYDALDRLIKKIYKGIDFNPDVTEKNMIEEYEYNEMDLINTKYELYPDSIEKRWKKYNYEYDSTGKVIKIIESMVSGSDTTQIITKMIYDKNGNLIETTIPGIDLTTNSEVKTRYVYDNMNRVIQIITNYNRDEYRKVRFIEYDNMGRVSKEYDMRAAGTYNNENKKYSVDESKKGLFSITYSYDMIGRLESILYPNGKREYFEYDKNGNLIRNSNMFGGTMFFWYDEMNRLVFKKVGNNNDESMYYSYYRNGLLKKEVLPKAFIGSDNISVANNWGIGTSYETIKTAIESNIANNNSNCFLYNYYFDNNLLKEVIDPFGKKEEYGYNDNGLICSKTLKTGATELYDYYKGGLLKNRTITDDAINLQKTEFHYDTKGNIEKYITGSVNDLVEKDFTYNEWGMLSSENESSNTLRSYEYYNNPYILKNVIHADNRIENFTYNPDNQINKKETSLKNQHGWNFNDITNIIYNSYGDITGTNSEYTNNGNRINYISESYGYDFSGMINRNGIAYNGINSSGDFSVEKKYDYNTGNEYVKYPGVDKFLKTEKDSFGRTKRIGKSESDYLYNFTYFNGNISKMESINGERSDYKYDILGRLTLIDSKYSLDNSDVDVFRLENQYDPNTGNVNHQSVKKISENSSYTSSSYTYNYDKASRLLNYEIRGLKRFKNIAGDETQRELIRNDYINLDSSITSSRPWLNKSRMNGKDVGVNSTEEIKDEITTDNQFRNILDESADIRFDISSSTLEIIYQEKETGIKALTIREAINTEFDEEKIRYWFDFYLAETDETPYIKVDALDYSIEYEKNRYVIIFNELRSAKRIKIHFNRDEINPLNFYSFSPYPYNSIDDTSVDTDIDRELPNYKISDEISSGIRGRLTDVIKVYAYETEIKETFEYDSSDRRKNDEDIANIGFKITTDGDRSFRYDKVGRRILTCSSEGTWIYRYDLAGNLSRVYFSDERYDITSDYAATLEEIICQFDYDIISEEISSQELTTNVVFDSVGFKLVEYNLYNNSGIRIYQWTEKEENNYYNTALGYFGKNDRLLIGNLGEINRDRLNGLTGIAEPIKTSDYENGLSSINVEVLTGFASISGDILNYHTDQLGSVRLVTKKENGKIIEKWSGDYLPYGELLTDDINNNWLPLKTFALHEHNTATDLIYAQHRWLDYRTGQFISEDPIKDGLNFYSYCGNNPIGMIDPTGLGQQDGKEEPASKGDGSPQGGLGKHKKKNKINDGINFDFPIHINDDNKKEVNSDYSKGISQGEEVGISTNHSGGGFNYNNWDKWSPDTADPDPVKTENKISHDHKEDNNTTGSNDSDRFNREYWITNDWNPHAHGHEYTEGNEGDGNNKISESDRLILIGCSFTPLAPVVGYAFLLESIQNTIETGDYSGLYYSMMMPSKITGTATVFKHGENHFSIKISNGKESLQTHQVVISDKNTTRIFTTNLIKPGEVTASSKVIKLDANSAMAKQKELLSVNNLGPYNVRNNSCITHVTDVLNAGGVPAPKSPFSSMVSFFKGIFSGVK